MILPDYLTQTSRRDYSDLTSRLDYPDDPLTLAYEARVRAAQTPYYPGYELDRDAVDSVHLGDINDASDFAGGAVRLTERSGNLAVRISKSVGDVRGFAKFADDLGLKGLANNQRLRLANSAMSDVKSLVKLTKALKVAGVVADVAGVVTDFSERVFGNASPAQTAPFKILDGTLTATMNYSFGAKTPIGAALDTLQDKIFGWKPVPVQDTNKGASSAISVTLEAMFRGEAGGGDEFMKRASRDEYGWIIRDAVELGIQYRDQWGGSERAWRTGQFWDQAPSVFTHLERPAAFAASLPVLGELGEQIGFGVGWYIRHGLGIGLHLPWEPYTDTPIYPGM